MTVAATSARLWPASERTAKEPELRPATNFATVISALTAMEASAALSLRWWASFIDISGSVALGVRASGPIALAKHLSDPCEGRQARCFVLYYLKRTCLADGCSGIRRDARTTRPCQP